LGCLEQPRIGSIVDISVTQIGEENDSNTAFEFEINLERSGQSVEIRNLNQHLFKEITSMDQIPSPEMISIDFK
jgi:hypothetical protein